MMGFMEEVYILPANDKSVENSEQVRKEVFNFLVLVSFYTALRISPEKAKTDSHPMMTNHQVIN